jgi:hypothetical protein
MTQTLNQKRQTSQMNWVRHCKAGSIKWDNVLLDQLCALTGESKMGLTQTIKELADGLGIELPRWEPRRKQ